MSGIGNAVSEIPSSGLPDVDKHSCQLLGPTALIVQALMGILVILSLVFKRHRERPKRPWRIWLFDVSKQVVGQLFVHVSNLLVSDITSGHASGNACVAYFLNILIDTTFGVALIYISLHALTRLFAERLRLKGFESGVYGDPPAFQFWIRQAALYLLSLTTMKLVVVAFLTLFPGVYNFGEWLLKWTWLGEEADFQVIFVMGIFPILMNIIQFWLIDSIVKASSMVVALDIEQGTHPDSEPLFQGGSDDEDDYHPPRPNSIHRRSSSLSNSRRLDPIDDRSFDTRTSEIMITKESTNHVDSHSYPPSLSGSISSHVASSHEPKLPRVAKYMAKQTKHRNIATVLSETPPLPGSSSLPRTPPQANVVPVVVEGSNWAESWDDADEWDHQKNDSLGTGDRNSLSQQIQAE